MGLPQLSGVLAGVFELQLLPKELKGEGGRVTEHVSIEGRRPPQHPPTAQRTQSGARIDGNHAAIFRN